MNQGSGNAINEASPSPASSSARPKRRSLLPQLGQLKAIARSTVPPDTAMDGENSNRFNTSAAGLSKPATSIPLARGASVSGSRLGQLRPRSMYQTGTTPADKSTKTEKPTTSQSMRPPSLLNKPSTTPSLGFGRTQSLRRPAVTTQSSPATTPATHARIQSSSTLAPVPSNTPRPRANAERPKSVHIPSTTGSQPSLVAPESAVTRKSTRLAGLSRTASVKTRPEPSTIDSRHRAITRPQEPALPQAKAREPVAEDVKKISRPAFSTLQQHFTPRKTGKAPTANFLHPAPVTTSNSLPPELVSLQMDLLQLHLLHEKTAESSRHWEMSAKRKLRLKFDEVASMYQVMLEHERSGQEQKNLQALLEWTGDKASASLVEYIQILSGPLHELPLSVQMGGRFQRLVTTFEKWVSWVEEVQAARQNQTEAGPGSIEGLGDAWKAENAALMRKLTSFARDLDGLCQPGAGSSIAIIVNSCKALLDGLLEELRVMQTIETDVVAKEKEWVETRLQGIAADIGSFFIDEVPAWRI